MIKNWDMIAEVFDMWNPGSAGDSWTSASEAYKFVRNGESSEINWLQIPVSLQIWLDAQFLFCLSPMDNIEILAVVFISEA